MTIRQWSVRRNEKIACHVTVRGEKAEDVAVVTGVDGGMVEKAEVEKMELEEELSLEAVFFGDMFWVSLVFLVSTSKFHFFWGETQSENIPNFTSERGFSLQHLRLIVTTLHQFTA